MPTTTTTTSYPPLPTLTPRRPDETAESYGLRTFAFVLAHDVTATLDDDALALATHVYRVAIDRADLEQTTIDRLAETDRVINQTLRRRAATAAQDAPGPTIEPAGRDTPRQGPGAPLTPAPKTNPPAPAYARPAPADIRF